MQIPEIKLELPHSSSGLQILKLIQVCNLN